MDDENFDLTIEADDYNDSNQSLDDWKHSLKMRA